MILHTLSAMSNSESFRDCLRTAQAGDAILLLGEGVYNGISGSEGGLALQASPARVVALAPDASAAGLTQRLGDIPMVDIDAFVALTEYYPRQLAWY